jgi:integrase
LTRITAENGPVQSNRTRTSLIRFLNWCIGEGYADINVAMQTNKNEEIRRERVLSDAELKIIWSTLPQGDFGEIKRLLILTAQRRDEIGDLRWCEIDFEGRTINIPAERMKNHRPHCVPLNDAAIGILKARKQNGRDYVFGVGAGGYSGWSQAKIRLDAAARINQHWTFHDLRRTAATRMGDLGVLPHIIEAVLGHVSGFRAGVAGIYNRASYESEKRAALDLWGSRVLRIVS